MLLVQTSEEKKEKKKIHIHFHVMFSVQCEEQPENLRRKS